MIIGLHVCISDIIHIRTSHEASFLELFWLSWYITALCTVLKQLMHGVKIRTIISVRLVLKLYRPLRYSPTRIWKDVTTIWTLIFNHNFEWFEIWWTREDWSRKLYVTYFGGPMSGIYPQVICLFKHLSISVLHSLHSWKLRVKS